ncbi:hypothetical protein LINPERPRIM_LOCUS6122 [Linum perenne]
MGNTCRRSFKGKLNQGYNQPEDLQHTCLAQATAAHICLALIPHCLQDQSKRNHSLINSKLWAFKFSQINSNG